MPTYGYRCSNCEYELEAFQKMSDAPLVRCPECDQDTLRRQLYPAGVLFKGSGYYTTDYRGSKGGSSNGSKSSSSPESGSSSDSKGSTGSEGKSSEGKSDSSSPSTPSD